MTSYLRVQAGGKLADLVEIADEGVSIKPDITPDEARMALMTLGRKLLGFYQAADRSPQALARENAELRQRVRELEAPPD